MRQYLIFSVFILFSYKSIAQINVLNRIQNSNLTINGKVKRIDSLLITLHNDSLFYLKSHYARWLYKNKKIKKSVLLSKEAFELIKNTSDTNNIQKTLFWTGYYIKYFNISESNNFYLKCLSLNNKNKIALNASYFLGNNYSKNKDYIKSNEYYKKSLILSQKQNIVSLKNSSLFNISRNYYALKGKSNLINSLKYAKITDSLFKINSSSNNNIYLNKLLLASIYNEEVILDIPKSLSYYKQALELVHKMNDSSKINNIILEIGNLYNTTNFKKSIYYLNRINPHKSDSTLISDLAFNYGLTYKYNKDYPNSIIKFQKSIKFKIGANFNISKNNDSILLRIEHKDRLLHILPLYAKTYYRYFKETKDTTLLTKSIFYYKLSDKLIDLIKENSTSFKSRMFWREKSEKIYSRAIESCYEANNIEDALFFMEKNKALLLSEDIASQNYKLTLGIDRDLLEKEEKYKKQLANIELNLTKNKDSLLQVKLDLERQLLLFQDSIYKGKLKKHKTTKIVTVKEIQSNLKQDEVFIEYHISSNNDYGIFSHGKNGFVIILTKSQTYFIKLNNLANLKDNLKEYLQLLKKPLKTKKELNSFSVKSFQIYNTIFPTKEIQELIKNKKLTIVSDGVLSFLPFESLVTKANNFEYLIYSTEISYAYSMTFQKENQLINRAAKNNFLGIAPLNFNYDTLSNLPETEYEIKNTSKLFKSNTLIGNEATKSTFLNSSNNYNIIHFATHADANNDKSPWIAFRNKKLFLNELYTTKTQADLIVLSACNTSLGKIETGEGVMSLARGFFYSGANSVVSSLWNVNDKTTTNLMSDFYSNLKNGETKSKALHNAKIKYLKTHSLSEISPYYWSSFILIGDSGNIELISDYGYYYWIIGLLITVALILLILRTKQK